MQLYLIRHAIAVDGSNRVNTPDGERALTEVGIEKMRKQSEALKKMKVEFDAVVTSPLLRAVQTAEIVCDVLTCPDRLERSDLLVPGANMKEAAKLLEAYGASESLALVGHNPDFELIAAALIGSESGEGIRFKKGAVCRIDLEEITPEPHGQLIWLLTPKLLRMLAD